MTVHPLPSPTPALVLLVGLVLGALPDRAGAQGSLTPPAAPAASMRTLTQVQPRTPLAGGTSGLTISQPGSYYLTGDLSVTTGHGILVSVDNVSIDLNGFTISSTASPASGFGVALIGGRAHVSVTNGHIRGTTTQTGGTFTPGGFISGIDYQSPPRNLRVSNVSVSGTANYGIDLGPDRASVISGCTVRTTSILGLQAGSVSDSAALEVGGANAIIAGAVTNVIGTRTVAGGTPVLTTEPTVSSVAAQVTALQATAGALESRTRLPGGAPLVISTPGSYYLAGSITAPSGATAITINADDVVLDLNGHTLYGLTGSTTGSGVLVPSSHRNITIRNGQIVGGTTLNAGNFTYAGFGDAIVVFNGSNIRAEKISVSNVGGGGILLGSSTTTTAQDCVVNVAAGIGISAQLVRNCAASNVAGIGIAGGTVSGCYARSFSTDAIFCRTAENCEGISDEESTNSGGGINCETATNCRGTGYGSSGVRCNVALNCFGQSQTAFGVKATQSAQNCYGLVTTTFGIALDAPVANNCTGHATANTTAINATIGVACRAQFGQLSITNRYLMP